MLPVLVISPFFLNEQIPDEKQKQIPDEKEKGLIWAKKA